MPGDRLINTGKRFCCDNIYSPACFFSVEEVQRFAKLQIKINNLVRCRTLEHPRHQPAELWVEWVSSFPPLHLVGGVSCSHSAQHLSASTKASNQTHPTSVLPIKMRLFPLADDPACWAEKQKRWTKQYYIHSNQLCEGALPPQFCTIKHQVRILWLCLYLHVIQ